MLLETLFKDMRSDEQIYVWRKTPSERHLFDSVSQVLEYAQSVCDDSDVYFGVGFRKRGSYDEVTRLPAAVADVDDKKGQYTQDELANHIAAFPVKPSFLISSGHGFHVYWLYPQPVAPEQGQEASRGFVSVVGSDAVHDPERILRIPGTKNHKDPTDVRDVVQLLAEPSRQYAASDIVAMAKLKDKMYQTIASGALGTFSSRSERDWVIIRSLLAAGVSEQGIRQIASQRPCGDRWREDSFRLLDLDLKNAQSSVGEAVRRFSEMNDCWFYEGAKGAHQVSTFVYEPHRLLYSLEGGEDVFLGTVRANDRTWNDVMFPRSAFSSQRNLLKGLTSMNWQWFGSDYETKQLLPFLMGRLLELDGSEAKATYVIGRHENYWVTKDLTVSATGTFTPSTAPYLYVDRSGHRSSSLSTVPDMCFSFLPEDEYRTLVKKISVLLPLINIPEVIMPVIGWFGAVSLKPLLREVGVRFPLLNVFGTMGSGKLLPNSEPVLTPNGWRKNGELKIGDFVIGRNGEATRILGVYPQGEQQIVRVTFSDGSWVRCSWDHLWSVQTPDDTCRRPNRWRTLTTRQLVDIGLIDSAGNRRWKIPVVSPVIYDPVTLPMDPYLFGVLLGDGSMAAGSLKLTTDEEIVDAIALVGTKGKHKSDGVVEFTERKGEIRGKLKELGAWGKHSWEKQVPPVFLRGTPSERLALLQGLFDTDGYAIGNGGVEFCSTSENLVDCVVELTQSLGGVAHGRRVTASTYTYKGERRKGRRAERVTLKFPPSIIPFRLSRKRDAYQSVTKYPPARLIAHVEEDGVEEATCIKVEAEDNLYVTRSFVVTHNTTILSKVLMSLLGITGVTNSANTTKFILRVLLSQSNAVPTLFGEFRESTTDSLDFYSMLRMLYDTGMDSRGHADQSTETYLLEAPVIVDGEDAFSDPALRQRSILVNTHPEDIAEGTATNRAFKELMALPLTDFGGHFIQHTLQETASSVKKKYDAALAETFVISPAPMPDRVRSNIAVVLMGVHYFSDFFVSHDGSALDMSVEVVEHLVNTVVSRLNTGTSRTLVDDFVEDMVTFMANDANFRIPFLAFYDAESNVLWFHMTTCVAWWGKEQRTRGKSALEAQALRAQINERCRDSVSYALPERMITTPGGEKLNCFGINIGRCHAAGMSVPNTLSAKSLMPRGLVIGRGIVLKKNQTELS